MISRPSHLRLRRTWGNHLACRRLSFVLALLVSAHGILRASAAEAASLVRWRDSAVEARFVGLGNSTASLQFEIEGGERSVAIGDILRFGGRARVRGGMVVGLEDGSQIACDRITIEEGIVVLRGGLFHQQRVPLNRVRSIVRRYSYDAAAAERLQRELRTVERTSDAIVTMSGEIVHAIIPAIGNGSAWRLGASDLDVVDLDGDSQHFPAARIRGVVFGQIGAAPRTPLSAANELSIGFTDGTYLARARFSDTGSVCHAELPEEAFRSDGWTRDSVCYLASGTQSPADVTLLSERRPIRYGVHSLFSASGRPLSGSLTPEPLQAGLNAALDGSPIWVRDQQQPFGLAMHPASTAIFIVPSGAILLGQMAQHMSQQPSEGSFRDESAGADQGRSRLLIATGADEATIRTVEQTGWAAAIDDPIPLRIELGTARIVVLSCESTSPAARPVLLDLRIATP